jgi:hypothetical protein
MSTNISETGRNDWIDAPDTKGRSVALRVVLITVCLIAAGVIVHTSLHAPPDVRDIAFVPNPP